MPPATISTSWRAGELIHIADGDRRAVVSEQGASLVQVEVAGTHLLAVATADGYASNGCHGQLLVPWPGRIPDGQYRYGGEAHQLPVDDLVTHSAIHGLVRWCPWQVSERSASSVTLAHRLLARPGYPFTLALEQSYAWRGPSLEMRTTATNLSDRTAPYGFGHHPYFTVGTPTVDDALLRVPATRYFVTHGFAAPSGQTSPVDGTGYDFHLPVPIGATELDVTLTGLVPDPDGWSRLTLASPDGSLRVTCGYGEAVRFIQLYSGDTLEEGKREGLAIEPYTCLPNAFNNGVGLTELRAGASLTVRWSITTS
jgi:aldose 1-epimerase